MKPIKFFILLVCFIWVTLGEFQADFTVYHKSDDIDQELKTIAKDCQGYMTHEIILKNPEMAMLTYTNPNSKKENKIPAFFIFGEHARELIAVETGLHFAKFLCGKAQANVTEEKLSYIRDNYVIKFVVNSNPAGRRLVEKGEYCLRMNHRGVDINRNWGDHWRTEQPDDKQYQTVPGSKPFSEPETESLRREIDKHKPKIFLDIHSGMKALLAPYAFKDAPVKNIKEITPIFEKVNDIYCKCEAGSAVKLLHYESYGCAMDYVYDHTKTKYSFAWEIYGPPEEELGSLNTHRLKRMKFMSKAMIRKMKQRSELAVIEDKQECFSFFNPLDKKSYEKTVTTWTAAIIDLLSIIEQHEKKLAENSASKNNESKDERKEKSKKDGGLRA